jgi:hypothetical protein
MPLQEETTTDLVVYSGLEAIGLVANAYAAQETFEEYQARRSANRLRRQQTFCPCFAPTWRQPRRRAARIICFALRSPGVGYRRAWSRVSSTDN